MAKYSNRAVTYIWIIKGLDNRDPTVYVRNIIANSIKQKCVSINYLLITHMV